jgi:hypothetical protein
MKGLGGITRTAALFTVIGFADRLRADSLFLPETTPADTTRPLLLDHTIVNPAEEMRQPSAASQPAEEGGMTHPWRMPAVTVYGQSGLREEERIGTYAQPLWTADRRFAETRIYVRPEGSLQFEWWYIPNVNRKGPTDFVTQFEVEFGLGYRLQLDLYLNPNWTGSGGATRVAEAIELRYALADWGKIWGNPTFYIELTHQDKGPEQLEMKILFGGELAPRWHWGWDLTYQRDMGGDNENTYETTAGLSYTLLDNRFDVGAEFKLQENEFRGSRGHFHDNILIGPSIQFRPLARMHIDFAPLIGLTHESAALQAYVVVGWEF